MCTLLKGRFLQYVATLTVSLQATMVAMCVMWTSPTLPQLMSDQSPIGVTITLTEMSAITAILVFGSIFGAIMLRITFDELGVKRTLLISCIPTAVGWILTAFAQSVIMLYIARFILGFSTIFAIAGCSIYIAEIAEPEIRGRLAILNAIMLEVGNITTVLVGAYTSYKVLALVSFMFPILFVPVFFFMPETPYFHLKRGDTKQALKVLQQFRGTENVSEELKKLEENINESMQNKGQFVDLFTNKNLRKSLVVVLITKTLHQLSGMNAIQQYMQPIFDQTSSGIDSTRSTIISVFIPIPAMFIASILIDRAGRKPLYYSSILGCLFALLCEFTYFTIQKSGANMDSLGWLPLTGIFVFFLAKSLGLTHFPYLLMAELFPPNIKNHAASLTLVYNACLLFIILFTFPVFSDRFGIDVSFMSFAVCLAIGFVFIVMFVPETKGKRLEQIQSDDRK